MAGIWVSGIGIAAAALAGAVATFGRQRARQAAALMRFEREKRPCAPSATRSRKR